jgi:regulator of nucleoside diphosphate kinase
MSKVQITRFDKDRLMRLLNKKKPHDGFDKALLAQLDGGELVNPKEVAPDVITMNSEIRFQDENGDDWKYWLVFPADADLKKNRISVLSPIGRALLGYKVGDTITLDTPQSPIGLTVKELIHQPEREGKFDL